MYPDEFLLAKLNQRENDHAVRVLVQTNGLVDFCSNDYLGLAKQNLLGKHQGLSGSGGSRLLAGNYPEIEAAEKLIANFHEVETALMYNSGYDANIGLLSAIATRTDTILYDQLAHASIRDGIVLSRANAFSFLHNDLIDLEKKLQQASGNCFIVTESLFSMDGDMADIATMVNIAEKYSAHLIVDEAHATGIIGSNGEGLVQSLTLQNKVFARVHTFGKALGCHGAVVLGSNRLKNYLINFSRSLMYTTALPPIAVEAVISAYNKFPAMNNERAHLNTLINYFQNAPISYDRLQSNTPIQGVIVPGNEAVKTLAKKIQDARIDVRPILYPTVPKGVERLRIILHAFNTMEELKKLCAILNG